MVSVVLSTPSSADSKTRGRRLGVEENRADLRLLPRFCLSTSLARSCQPGQGASHVAVPVRAAQTLSNRFLEVSFSLADRFSAVPGHPSRDRTTAGCGLFSATSGPIRPSGGCRFRFTARFSPVFAPLSGGVLQPSPYSILAEEPLTVESRRLVLGGYYDSLVRVSEGYRLPVPNGTAPMPTASRLESGFSGITLTATAQ